MTSTSNITYYLNWMGPLSGPFADGNWSAGRIDIDDGTPFGLEYGVDIMSNKSWRAMSEWMWRLTTDIVLPKDELFRLFEESAGCKIEWARPELMETYSSTEPGSQ